MGPSQPLGTSLWVCPACPLPQVYTAIYYVLADLGMLSLYCYYRVKNGGRACELGQGWGLCSPWHWEQGGGDSRGHWEPGEIPVIRCLLLLAGFFFFLESFEPLGEPKPTTGWA